MELAPKLADPDPTSAILDIPQSSSRNNQTREKIPDYTGEMVDRAMVNFPELGWLQIGNKANLMLPSTSRGHGGLSILLNIFVCVMGN